MNCLFRLVELAARVQIRIAIVHTKASCIKSIVSIQTIQEPWVGMNVGTGRVSAGQSSLMQLKEAAQLYKSSTFAQTMHESIIMVPNPSRRIPLTELSATVQFVISTVLPEL